MYSTTMLIPQLVFTGFIPQSLSQFKQNSSFLPNVLLSWGPVNEGTLRNESYTVTFYVYGILAKLCLCFKYDKILIYTKKSIIPTRISLSKRGELLWNDLSKTVEIGGIISLFTSYEFSWYRLNKTHVII